MKLKSIEIYGFKSFADKTVLSFGEGITAVVGPNGSGKSNISDAVRWVLGEQSNKTLRGLKMENVIFGGTAVRKQMGYAEVTLTIDNTDRQIDCDSDDITITRRYYRSGESEYRINNASVRLKDVHEMFMDTGLGRDGYSMVGQGKIDTIVSSKTSEERRDIFEEAAGISRYRYRKTEAERKLKAAEENLVRLRDILSELEMRVGPLKTQSEKAQKFLELSKEQEYLQIGLWMNTITKYKEQLREQEMKITAAREQYDEISAQSVKLDSDLDVSSDQVQQLIVLADQARQNAASFEEQAAVVDGEINVEKNTLYHNGLSIERIQGEIAALKEGDSDIYADIDTKKTYITEKQEKVKSLEQLLNDANTALLNLVNESDSYSSKMEELNSKLNQLSVAVSDHLVKKMSAQSAKEERLARQETVIEAIAQKEQRVLELSEEFKALQDDLDRCDETIDSCQNSLHGRQLLLDSRREKCEKQKENIEKLKLNQEEKRRRAQILEDLEKNMDGFGFAIKTVMQNKKSGQLRGIHGTVSSILSVKKEYAIAIECALGNAIQNIITDQEGDAKRAVRYLKENKAGRATFLPLTSVKPRLFQEKGLDDCEGYVGIASKLVSTDSKYENIVSSLLGHIIIVDDIDSAVSLAKKYNYRFKVVTLDGQVVNAGGSITGGSLSKHVGILSRANDIAAFREQVVNIQNDIDTASKEYERSTADLAKMEAEIITTQSELKTAQEDKIRVLGEMKRVSEQLDSAKLDIEGLKAEQKEANSKIDELQESIAQSDIAIADIESQSSAMQEQLQALTGGRDEISAKREELNSQSNDLRTKIFENRKDIEVLESSVIELNTRIEGQAQRNQSLTDELKALEASNLRIEEKIVQLQEKAVALRAQSKQAEESIAVFHQQRDQLEQSTYEKRAEQKTIIETKERLNGELVRLGERKVSMVHNYDEIIRRLYDEYGLTKSEAEERNIVLDDIPQAQLKLNELKRSIKSLGSVNVSAIEEYKEVSERYEYLSGQIKDLENTRDELFKLINSLIDQMQTVFLERFSSINAYFQKIFCELFGGGTAELRLTDPEHVLESGIEILAQPPGKNVAIIEQLSGGEKALIAISIYFAVMKVNPPPFCILDEVDAALDDVNVVRFAEYLRKMSTRTQYILITHRRGSMEEADILYGVTMQEKGVTKLLELDIAEAEKNISQD